ncbi:hypothetical protein C9374_006548 [Naegleria lovaniensis]|uniref:Uncharacterized protein n=1 Tax=Naegleria lovaniensis TaxID=51637 RepID=A0AA88GN44_NAELO|nr:uncharacterized protein C9374_006548 [Naegleria lovaniensis]KAG2379431.1 hypothetical protein C9374_006548 [Naegleria lovaniensis]
MYPLHPHPNMSSGVPLMPSSSSSTTSLSSANSFQPQPPQGHVFVQTQPSPQQQMIQPFMYPSGSFPNEMNRPSNTTHPSLNNHTTSTTMNNLGAAPPSSFAFTHFVPTTLSGSNASSQFPMVASSGPQGFSFLVSNTHATPSQAGMMVFPQQQQQQQKPQQQDLTTRQTAFASPMLSNSLQETPNILQISNNFKQPPIYGQSAFVPYTGLVQEGSSVYGLNNSSFVFPIQNLYGFQNGQVDNNSARSFVPTSNNQSEQGHNSQLGVMQPSSEPTSCNNVLLPENTNRIDDHLESSGDHSFFLVENLKHEPTIDSRLKDFERDILTSENHNKLTTYYRHLQKENAILKQELKQFQELRRNMEQDLTQHHSQLMSVFTDMEKHQDNLEETNSALARELDNLLSTRCK